MNRNISTPYQVKGVEAQETDLDTYKSKLTKLIPGEIVTGYLFIKGSYEAILKIAEKDSNLSVGTIDTVMYIAIFGLILLTPILYRKAFKIVDNKQLFLTVLAFSFWVFSIGGPFDSFFHPEFKGFLSGILLLFFTLIAPLFFPSKTDH